LRRHPRIDVVIGNAAMVENGPFLDIRPDQWQAHLDLNLTGNFHVGQAAARIMVEQEPAKKPGCERGVRGKILFNSSWCQDTPWPEGCCYGVAKAGLALMTKAMAQELAVYGIRVNIVAPGIILAGLSKVCYETDPKYAPRATAAIPLREFGTPAMAFWIYAGVSAVAFLFALIIVPETKGRTLEELGASWSKKAKPTQ